MQWERGECSRVVCLSVCPSAVCLHIVLGNWAAERGVVTILMGVPERCRVPVVTAESIVLLRWPHKIHTRWHTHTHTSPLMCHSFHRKATRLLDGCQQLVVQLVIVLVGGNVNPVKAGQRGKGDREGKGRGGEKEFGRERSTFLVWVDSFEKPLTFPIDKGITFYFRVKIGSWQPIHYGMNWRQQAFQ